LSWSAEVREWKGGGGGGGGRVRKRPTRRQLGNKVGKEGVTKERTGRSEHRLGEGRETLNLNRQEQDSPPWK